MACPLDDRKPLSEPIWNIVNLTIGNKRQWNLNWNFQIFSQENASEYVVWKMTAILSRPQSVNLYIVSSNALLWPSRWKSIKFIRLHSREQIPSIAITFTDDRFKNISVWKYLYNDNISVEWNTLRVIDSTDYKSAWFRLRPLSNTEWDHSIFPGHKDLGVSYGIKALDNHYFRSAPTHYLNQCWLIVYWTRRNKLQWIRKENTKRSFNTMLVKCLQNGGHFDQTTIKTRMCCQ